MEIHTWAGCDYNIILVLEENVEGHSTYAALTDGGQTRNYNTNITRY
jgi:hypothetical protein